MERGPFLYGVKRLLLLLLLVSAGREGVHAQTGPVAPEGVLRIDSVVLSKNISLNSRWRYHDGDSAAWALPAYSDGHWAKPGSLVTYEGKDAQPFSGICWFRLRVEVDSAVAGLPLAMSIEQFGASEVFLDGKRLRSFGRIGGPGGKGAAYTDPQGEPYIFRFSTPGAHTLAVRHAEWNARQTWGRNGAVGFEMALGEANARTDTYVTETKAAAVTLIFMSAVFFALGLLHFLLWLYQRGVRSNGLFSLFSLCVSLFFLDGYIESVSHSARLQVLAVQAVPFIGLLMCLSLSGFINALFGRRRWHHRLILGAGLLIAAALIVFRADDTEALVLVLVVAVALETIVLTMIAIARRVPGARIVGSGIGVLTLLVLLLFVTVLVNGGGFQITGAIGRVLLLIVAAAIIAVPTSMSAYLAWNFATVNKQLKAELAQVAALSEKTRMQEEEKARLLQNRQEELEREVDVRTAELRSEKKKSDDLLLNILPSEVAEELKASGTAQTRLHNDVTVLFTDFVDFTIQSSAADPVALVQEIDHCFCAFDDIVTRHGLEKIKTIGDAYMAAAGLPAPHPDGAAAAVRAALEIRDFILLRRAQNPAAFTVRIGVHTGPVVAGIVGVKKFAYDVWGDTVNTAARMESSGEEGKVNISAATHDLIKDRFVCMYRGEVAAKGKGAMGMYFVEKAVAGIPFQNS